MAHLLEGKEDVQENVDGKGTSSHDSKKFRTRSMEKQGGMAFGFRKTATAVIKPDGWIDRPSFNKIISPVYCHPGEFITLLEA
jgi:hypothetical protein